MRTDELGPEKQGCTDLLSSSSYPFGDGSQDIRVTFSSSFGVVQEWKFHSIVWCQ